MNKDARKKKQKKKDANEGSFWTNERFICVFTENARKKKKQKKHNEKKTKLKPERQSWTKQDTQETKRLSWRR